MIMNNIKLTKAENGKGWYLDIENVIFQTPVTALELISLGKMIEDMKEELLEDLD